MLWRCPRCREINVEEMHSCRQCDMDFTPAFILRNPASLDSLEKSGDPDEPTEDDAAGSPQVEESVLSDSSAPDLSLEPEDSGGGPIIRRPNVRPLEPFYLMLADGLIVLAVMGLVLVVAGLLGML